MPARHLPGGHLPGGHLPGGHLPGVGQAPVPGFTPVIRRPSFDDYGELIEEEMGYPQFVKTPDEETLIPFYWASKLDGETISSLSYELPDGLTNEGELGAGTQRYLRISGGDAVRLYRVIGKVTTSTGRDLEVVKRVRVVEG